MSNILKGLNTKKTLREGISQEDLANTLFNRLEYRYPDIVSRYGHEVVGDAVMSVADFHAGAEELGSSDISIMLRQILKHLENYALDEAAGDTYLDPQTALYQARKITKQFKYADMHTDIVVQIQQLAEKSGIDPRELQYQIDEVYEKQRELESAIYALDEVFEDNVRNKEYADDVDEGQIYSTGGGAGQAMRWYTPKDNLGEGEEMSENLHKWFKEKWVRFGPDGKIRGDCARGDDSEGKPKCLPQSKAHSLGKKGRASAASRKRREDPNPERSGKAINVNTKKTNEEQLDELSCWSGYHRVAGTKAGFPGSCAKNKTNEEQHSESCPHCGGEMVSEELMNEKKDACYYKVKSRYKVWPSAYASGALVKCRKKGASNWGTGGKSNESIEEGWKEEAQELEDWTKEVNMRLYRAHESQRLGLARQLSKLEQKHFGSEFTHPNLTNIVWSALRALQKGDMVHYDPQRVGQMPFGSAVGDDAKLIAQYNITRDELAGYRMLHDKNMVDNLEQFLKLRRLVRAKSWSMAYLEELEQLTPEEAWLKMANDLNWSKDDMNEEVQSKTDDKLLAYYAQRKAEKQKQQSQSQDQLDEKWTQKYKDSINCSNPKGFSQKAHCAGQKPKRESAIMKGLVDETKGLPYPGTYEQETSMITRKGPQRIRAMTYENKQGRK